MKRAKNKIFNNEAIRISNGSAHRGAGMRGHWLQMNIIKLTPTGGTWLRVVVGGRRGLGGPSHFWYLHHALRGVYDLPQRCGRNLCTRFYNSGSGTREGDNPEVSLERQDGGSKGGKEAQGHRWDTRVPVYPTIAGRLKFRGPQCTNALEVISDRETLLIAYKMVKSNPGNMTKGSDKETLDGITRAWFVKAEEGLRGDKYTLRPARRVYIPKSNGKKRPLGISSPRDKIVQQSVKLVLDCIFEPHFLNTSHGFRPYRGCHSALRELREWKGVAWFVEGDIKSFFDTIDHHELERLLSKRIKDPKFFHLYWKLVKAGYVEWNTKEKQWVDALEGVPQGGIVSPIMSNIMLHELDVFVNDKMYGGDENGDGRKRYIVNQKYQNLNAKVHRLRKKLRSTTTTALKRRISREVRRICKLREKLKSTVPNPGVTSTRYVRYADDWLIGVWGPKAKAISLRQGVEAFLRERKLTLSLEKTLITNARNGRAEFLGVHIKRIASSLGPVKHVISRGRNRRVSGGNTWMTAPVPSLVEKLKKRGFLEEAERWRPLSIAKFLPLNDRDIIHRYNTIARGLFNYYSFVDNRSSLSKVRWILMESLKRTLMRKHRMNKSQLERKYGKNVALTINKTKRHPGKRIVFYNPDLKRVPMRFLNTNKLWEPFRALDWKVSIKDKFGSPCALCGANGDIEMHHLRHIRNLNSKLGRFDQMLARVNRKQIPLCGACHLRVHRGKYQGQPLSHMDWV